MERLGGIIVLALFVLTSCGVNSDLPQEVTSGTDCFDTAQSSASRSGLLGGYRAIANPSSNQDVMAIIHSAMARLNSLSSNEENYRLDTDSQHQIVAYKQLVNGLNYCVRFHVRSTTCTDADVACNETPKTFVCDAAAYRGFRDAAPNDVDAGPKCYP